MRSTNYSTILFAGKIERTHQGDLVAQAYLAKSAVRKRESRRMRRERIRKALAHEDEIALVRQTAQKNEVHAQRHRQQQIQDGKQHSQKNVLDLAH
jgi:hypothetical protein